MNALFERLGITPAKGEPRLLIAKVCQGVMSVELGKGITVNYVRATHQIHICRGSEIIRTDEVPEGYTASAFLDCVDFWDKIYKNQQ